MGTWGIRFRALLGLTGVSCAVLAAGCRTSRVGLDIRSQIRVSEADLVEPSFVLGHRFGRWLEVEPEPESQAALEEACLVEQTGEPEEAIAVLSEALEDDRESAALLAARGALYLGTGYPRAAAGDFQRAVTLAPEQGRGWFALGHAYEVLGLCHQATEALERAVCLGEDQPALYLSLARVQRELGHAGKSARNYELALTRLPERPREILVEAAVLATEDHARAAGVEALRDRLESCSGVRLSDDAWLLRALMRELPPGTNANVGATFRAMEIAPAELAALTESLLTAVQLFDPETRAERLAELLAAEPDPSRRAALERCLTRR